MSRVALLDVNILVALFYADHVHHELAHDWFADHQASGWATCPLTENGFVRLVLNPATGIPVQRPADVLKRFRKFCESQHHTFWNDTVSLSDTRVFNSAHIRGYRQLTDVYLLGLATHHQGALATFDASISLAAVTGATEENLQVIAPTEEPS